MARLPNLQPEALDPEQRRVHDAIVAGPRGVVQGPLQIWLHSAAFADRAQALGEFCRYRTSLPRRLSELAILVAGGSWQAGFEWAAHAPEAVKAGIDPQAVEAIRTGRRPELPREDEAAVYALAHELIENRQLSEATYKRAAAVLDSAALVELVGVIGYYTLIAMTIKAFEVPLPPGAADPFPQS